MILQSAKFKIRLTEKPVIMVKVEGKPDAMKDWGCFIVGKKYRVYAVYDDSQHPTAFLLADETRTFIWISTNICRRA